MVNKITEKYFSQADFSRQLNAALGKILARTGFQIEKEIWRGCIYQKNKVGSVIFSGKYGNKPAILKIQGLRPEMDEIDIIKKFNQFNKSRKIKVPKLLLGKRWNQKDGFGFLILEMVTARRIFDLPIANKRQRNDFCRFYNEYRTKTVAGSWWKNDELSRDFILRRLNHWMKICKSNGCWSARIHSRLIRQFKRALDRRRAEIPMLFSHGHLSANDIFIQRKKFVLMSNLFWGFRPKYYDLAFNLWAILLRLPGDTSFAKALHLINAWTSDYRKISWVKKQNDFDGIFPIILLERLIGSILIDLCVGRRLNRRLLGVQLQLFDYYVKKI